MFVTSFYSYKGGVGRTACLLNTAWLMALRGRKVMMLDLDLEAPGLSSAHLKSSGVTFEPCPPSKGFCELVYDATRHNGFPRGWNSTYMLEDLGPDGRMGLMSAGEKGAKWYEQFIQSFSWREFYSGSRGDLFMEALLRGFHALGYEYLFIDARTGHTDVADITTVQLPDLVVFVTNLTDQSVDGIASRIRTVNENNNICISDQGCPSRKAGFEKVPIQKLVVASPLPRGELSLRQSMVEKANDKLGTEARIDVQVDYLDLLALGERNQIVFQQMNPKHLEANDFFSGVCRPYQRLADEISRRNPGDPENPIHDGSNLIEFGLWRLAMAHHIEAIGQVEKATPDRFMSNPAYIAASLEKIRAHLEALSPGEDMGELEGLQDLIKDASRDQQIDNARLWLALSWPFILLNQFKEAAETAGKAGDLAKELLGKDDRCDHDLLDLQALAALREGYAYTLCSDWEKARERTNYARECYEKLAARPLLHGLSLTQLARIELVLGNMDEAARWLSEAATRFISEGGEESPAPRINSKHVQADYFHALGLMHYERGKGKEAADALEKAQSLYSKVNDDVGELDLFVLRVSLAMLSHQDVESKIKKARELRIPASAGRLNLRTLANKAQGLSSKDFGQLLGIVESNNEPNIFNDDVINSDIRKYDPAYPELVRLDYIRHLMTVPSLTEGQIGEARTWLDSWRGDSNPTDQPGIRYEIDHQLRLTRSMFELAYGNGADQTAISELIQYSSDMETEGYSLRRVQTLLALAFMDHENQTQPLLGALEGPNAVIQKSSEWNWLLPLAFVFVSKNQKLKDACDSFRARLTPFLPQSADASAS
ncbi:MAG: hypothetical protein KJ558_04625 [Gammaproteobacteria bacterium]|nr:hypothetical protein [Gammaproteobacteria bacterium]MBU1654105.1 hypothetical protein [Gammaproteobacteria bacterium]MBU1961678.1 hypothetical protein [Gammaproteobacteria bacterium]